MRTSVLMAILFVASVASAQSAVADGATLAALFPPTLGGLPRAEVNAYDRFATTSYREPNGDLVVLQFHEVIGAGAADYQRRICPTVVPIAHHDACVSQRGGSTHVTRVLEDRLQINLGAPSEAEARRVAATLDLGPVASLATRVR